MDSDPVNITRFSRGTPRLRWGSKWIKIVQVRERYYHRTYKHTWLWSSTWGEARSHLKTWTIFVIKWNLNSKLIFANPSHPSNSLALAYCLTYLTLRLQIRYFKAWTIFRTKISRLWEKMEILLPPLKNLGSNKVRSCEWWCSSSVHLRGFERCGTQVTTVT